MLPRGSIGMRGVRRGSEDAAEEGRDRYYGVHHDIDCESCAARIMNNVPVIGKGIKDIQVDVPSKEATVTYDSAKTSPEELIKGFGKIRIKAEEKPGK